MEDSVLLEQETKNILMCENWIWLKIILKEYAQEVFFK